jgi:hypothetical protein
MEKSHILESNDHSAVYEMFIATFTRVQFRVSSVQNTTLSPEDTSVPWSTPRASNVYVPLLFYDQ